MGAGANKAIAKCTRQEDSYAVHVVVLDGGTGRKFLAKTWIKQSVDEDSNTSNYVQESCQCMRVKLNKTLECKEREARATL